MAVDSIRFQVLDVGQGTGNFIELYDGTKIVNTILIDLGSEGKKTAAGGPSAAYIVTALKSMTTPTIDTVILSHSDSDHINLLEQVLGAFHPPGSGKTPVLKINFVRYGGEFTLYKKGTRKNVIDRLIEFAGKANVKAMGTSYTSFTKGASSTPLRVVNGVKLYIIVGNTPVPSAATSGSKRTYTDSFAINTKSIVVLLDYTNVQFVATGDATGVTLASCNDNITADVKKTFLTWVFMVTLPHHGSATTTFDIKGIAKGPDVAQKNLQRFVERIGAKTITASAERRRTFKHPSADVMSYFWPTLDSTSWFDKSGLPGNRHFYTAYFETGAFSFKKGTSLVKWPSSDWWYSVETAANVFTNLYFDWFLQGWSDSKKTATLDLPPVGQAPVASIPATPPQPPLGVAWTYGVTSAFTVWMDWIENRAALIALQQAIDAEIAPEDMPEAEHLHQPVPPDAVAIDELPADGGGRSSPVEGRDPAPESEGEPAPEPCDARRPGPAPGFERMRIVP